jgi:tetratricopeptide (TPR) repeat protein
MVATFRSAERNLGVQAAETIRERLASDINIQKLWIIPKSDITNTLEQSGYSTTEALNPNDARQLATLLRAEEYLDGAVLKTQAGGFRVQANWLFVRGDGMVQPLPAVEAGKLDQLAKSLSNEFQNAHKTADLVKQCMQMSRAKKYTEALAEARKAITIYPQSSMARVCIADIYSDQKQPPDSMVKIAEEILAIDKQNRRALAFAADAYNAKGLDDKYIETLTTLLSVDPTNTRLQTTIVNALGAAKRPELAKPIIDDAVKQNPGDPQLVRMQWLIYLQLKDWKGVATIGEEMVKTDTAAADTNFFVRMAAAYDVDSQPQKAAELASRGVAKFPNNDNLAVMQTQLLRKAGQTQQALEAVEKLLARNPKAPNAWLQKAQIQVELNQPADSILSSLKSGVDNGEDKNTVAGYATSRGQAAYRAATTSKAPDDYRQALAYLRFAESVQPSENSAFLLGVSSLSLGQQLLTDARDQKSCDLAKEAQNLFVDAQINLPKGGRAFPEPTRQALTGLQTLAPYGDQLVKALCK